MGLCGIKEIRIKIKQRSKALAVFVGVIIMMIPMNVLLQR